MKYVGLHWPLLPYSLPVWKALTSGVGHGLGHVAQAFQSARGSASRASR